MLQPSVAEVDSVLTGPGGLFEIETIEIDGRPTRMWKDAPRVIGDILDRGCELAATRDLLVLGDERLTHEVHRDQARRLAVALVEKFGVGKGDRVAIATRNVPEWSVAFFASVMAGAIATPLNAFWNSAELAFAIADAEPTVLIADGERFERLSDATDALRGTALIGTRLDYRKTDTPLPTGIIHLTELLKGRSTTPGVNIEPDDLATIFYTSGTTSHPKGVLGTHRNMCANVVSTQFVAARGAMRAGVRSPSAAPPPVVLVPVPLFHGTGCHSGLVSQVWAGGTVVLMRKWDSEAALDVIERERVTSVTAVPTMVWDLLNDPSIERRDLSTLRGLGGGGAAAPPQLVRRLQEVLPGRGSGTGYGMTESSSLTTSIGGADYVALPRSVGVPVPIVDVRIAGDDGSELPVGQAGEIWIKGPTVVAGYWRRPEETSETFVDGWLRSGDLGELDDEEFLFIVDRAKDSGRGEHLEHRGRSCTLRPSGGPRGGCVPVPHDALGDEVGAVVRLKADAPPTTDELREHTAGLLRRSRSQRTSGCVTSRFLAAPPARSKNAI
jgi:acyl-CoA synthetase (AMP-forming)/AMP-acid ligase II